MALTYGFYNSVDGDRTYDAIQMGQIFDGIITDGVYATFLKAMVVKASDNPSEVIVQPGRCWFNHTWTYIDADYPITAPAPEVILDRVDALVIDINTENAFRENSLVWVQGTPSSLNPERPTLIKSVTHNQYPLCYVYRKAGTTMIYAADITNAVGTSETPFVTGVLQGINIDDLLAQWDDEFHTWEAATKTSFESWMVNQQSVYVTWFDSIKDQMEDDLTSFEEWVETIRGIIDEEAATHLQAEIDELKDMLPAGSHIDISTNETTLFNRNVTVSDGVHSKTVQFDSIGGATVESFPYIGIISVTSTDGTRTAEESINIPYFGRYSATLAFWSATVSLLGDESLAGLQVTVRDGNGDVVDIVTLNGFGQGVFTATKPDTYKFIYTYGGQTMEVSLAVTQETTYEVEIHGGFDFQAWLLAGRVSETFSSLDEILADEPTLRQLMLVHDSVDYICDTFNESMTSIVADITKIFNTDLAAKWINLSDYALDHFYAVADIKTVMDTADKYGYGEWTLVGQVPTMTSNTSPYGEVSADKYFTNDPPYYAFDGNDSTGWSTYNQTNPTSGKIRYKFTTPVCVKKLTALIPFDGSYRAKSYKVNASNDGSTYTTIASGTFTEKSQSTTEDVEVNSTSSYLYWELEIEDTYGGAVNIRSLQFYAWASKGNVPVMTSNNAPYGEVGASKSPASGYAYYPWCAFNDNYNGWFPDGAPTSNQWLQYKFTNPVCVRQVLIKDFGTIIRVKNFKIQGSNDGATFTDIYIGQKPEINMYKCSFDNSNYYLYYRLFMVDSYGGQTLAIEKLQFYGRELKVSVPNMTSNTAPFGVVSASDYASGGDPYKAFDADASSAWTANTSTSGSGSYVEYEFPAPVIIKQIYAHLSSNLSQTYTYVYKILAKDGDSWVDLVTDTTVVATNNDAYVYHSLSDNETPYSAYRIYKVSSTTANKFRVWDAQLWGLDYSEKEFEAGSTKKWLYDHGVELETLTLTNSNSNATGEKRKESLFVKKTSTNNSSTFSAYIDFYGYSLMRCKLGNSVYTSNSDLNDGHLAVYSSIPVDYTNDSNRVANQTILTPNSNSPYNWGLDVSSINQTHYAIFGVWSAGSATMYNELREWWLE